MSIKPKKLMGKYHHHEEVISLMRQIVISTEDIQPLVRDFYNILYLNLFGGTAKQLIMTRLDYTKYNLGVSITEYTQQELETARNFLTDAELREFNAQSLHLVNTIHMYLHSPNMYMGPRRLRNWQLWFTKYYRLIGFKIKYPEISDAVLTAYVKDQMAKHKEPIDDSTQL
jgi:hypothetical protein